MRFKNFLENKMDHWKQPNPQMQLMAILMSVEGNISLIEEGINVEKSLKRLRDHAAELGNLKPYLSESW